MAVDHVAGLLDAALEQTGGSPRRQFSVAGLDLLTSRSRFAISATDPHLQLLDRLPARDLPLVVAAHASATT